ncbi:MAG: hypothetical protein AAB454_00845 [Patescibacteria group bacterium]
MKLLLIVLLLAFASGCAVIGATADAVNSMFTIKTNIPFFYGYSYEIVNASDYNISVTANGWQQKFQYSSGKVSEMIAPGESVVIPIKNWSGTILEATITVKAWDNKKLVGATTRKVYIYGNRSQANTWIIQNHTIAGSGWWW